jgi:hypothetical protein
MKIRIACTETWKIATHDMNKHLSKQYKSNPKNLIKLKEKTF